VFSNSVHLSRCRISQGVVSQKGLFSHMGICKSAVSVKLSSVLFLSLIGISQRVMSVTGCLSMFSLIHGSVGVCPIPGSFEFVMSVRCISQSSLLTVIPQKVLVKVMSQKV